MKSNIAVAALGLVLAGAHGPAEGMEIIGRMENGAGGEMLVTSAKCAGSENGRIIMSSGPNGGQTIHGCAYLLPPDRLYVSWDRGDTTVLPLYGWTPDEAAPSRRPAPVARGRPARVYR